eukprot:12920819-Prorocentrum_lima.AAC.1
MITNTKRVAVPQHASKVINKREKVFRREGGEEGDGKGPGEKEGGGGGGRGGKEGRLEIACLCIHEDVSGA